MEGHEWRLRKMALRECRGKAHNDVTPTGEVQDREKGEKGSGKERNEREIE